MYIRRNIEDIIISTIKHIPIIGITGPRQSGKTTMVKHIFPDYEYVSLENPDIREFAINDPRNFLENYNKFIIFDEIQRVPDLLSYIQEIVDNDNLSGRYILTGSNNILLMDKISQTLAGRIILFKLLPFSYYELQGTEYEDNNIESLLFMGLYPRIYDTKISPELFFQTYIDTYVERDVRAIKNISNLQLYQKLMKLCAGRIGKELNLTSLGNNIGVDSKTINSWISILETSYIVFKLPPYYKNYNKRLIKTPKMYFFDTGLACSLLGIKNEEQLKTHYLFGELFENFVINELVKYSYNKGYKPELFFWKDKTGNEIDCIIELADSLSAIEIKSGKTIANSFFKNLKYFNELANQSSDRAFIIYTGEEDQERKYGKVLNWRKIKQLMDYQSLNLD